MLSKFGNIFIWEKKIYFIWFSQLVYVIGRPRKHATSQHTTSSTTGDGTSHEYMTTRHRTSSIGSINFHDKSGFHDDEEYDYKIKRR